MAGMPVRFHLSGKIGSLETLQSLQERGRDVNKVLLHHMKCLPQT